MTDSVHLVETACTTLTNTGRPVTFTAVAEHTGLSRTTLYRNNELRAVIEDHRHHSHDPRTLTGMHTEIAHLRTALEALAERVRQHEERLRHIEHRQPHPKANTR